MTHRSWKGMASDEKRAAIQSGRARGLTDEEIGDELGATKGQVVGFRHRHVPELTGKERGVSSKKNNTTAQERGLAQASNRAGQNMAPKKPLRGLLSDPPSRPKLTNDELLMCTYVDPDDGKRCSFIIEDARTRRCRLHLH